MRSSKKLRAAVGASALIASILVFGCSTERVKSRAMETAAKYWQDKAYPGKGYDVQVLSAEKADDGLFRVKGTVDHEAREGTYNPESDTFSEGYYPLQREKGRRVAELEQEVKYWKSKSEDLERENFKLKVRLGIDGEKKSGGTPAPISTPDSPDAR